MGSAPDTRADLLDTAQHLAAIVEGSDDAIISKDVNGTIVSWNKGAERLFGYSASEVLGKSITILIPADRLDEEPGILARIRAGERTDHYETVRRRKDGSLVDISLTVSPIRNATGEIVGASKIARDISERRQAEARLNLLAREVDHRAKNVLTTVMALVRMTQSDTVAGYTNALTGRLRALSNVHSVLSKSRWAGAEVKPIVEEELRAFSADGGRNLKVSGPQLNLSPDAAQTLAMSVHELATNSAKYGAFSVGSGSVAVEWSVADGYFVVRWVETGGPPVRTPSRSGFGTKLIEMTVEPFGGDVHFDWRPEGLSFEMRIPASKLARA